MKDKKENLKKERMFDTTMEKVAVNNHEVVTTEQEKKDG